MGWGEGDIQMCDVVVVVVDGPPQMGDGQDSAQSIHSQTGYSPGAPKAAPEAPKVAKTQCALCDFYEKDTTLKRNWFCHGPSKSSPGGSNSSKNR